jgi:hypothetical protein
LELRLYDFEYINKSISEKVTILDLEPCPLGVFLNESVHTKARGIVENYLCPSIEKFNLSGSY